MTATTARRLAIALGGAYLVGYLIVIGDLSLARTSGWHGAVAAAWHEMWLKARSLVQFEAIAQLQAGRVVWLISPLNLAIASVIAALVAINIHGAIEIRRQPAACRPGGSSAGLVAGLPALLAGGACCAPALIILLGLPALGAFAGLFGWLVPVSIALLVASRWWQRRLGAPGFVGTAG